MEKGYIEDMVVDVIFSVSYKRLDRYCKKLGVEPIVPKIDKWLEENPFPTIGRC